MFDWRRGALLVSTDIPTPTGLAINHTRGPFANHFHHPLQSSLLLVSRMTPLHMGLPITPPMPPLSVLEHSWGVVLVPGCEYGLGRPIWEHPSVTDRYHGGRWRRSIWMEITPRRGIPSPLNDKIPNRNVVSGAPTHIPLKFNTPHIIK
jgi:hypothetical protein